MKTISVAWGGTVLSSSAKLWPIYVATNEIPVKSRFAKKDMIVTGLLHCQYMDTFSIHVMDLYGMNWK